MSGTSIEIPSDLLADDQEGVVTLWLYNDGAHVTKGAVIAEIMVEKAQMEVLAPEEGVLRIMVPAEGVICKGAKIGEIDQ